MRAGLSIVRLSCRLAAVLVTFGTPALSMAQGQLGTIQGLKDAWSKTSDRRGKLLSGEVQPGKGDKDIAEATANYLLWRFTHETELAEPKRVAVLHQEFNTMVAAAVDRKGNRPYLDGYLAPALAASLKEILTRDVKSDRAVVVHAISTLPMMAKLMNRDKTDAIGEMLVDLVKDPKSHDVVRLYALKALREAMPITEQPEEKFKLDLKDPAQNNQRARDTKYVDALRNYIEQPFDAATLMDEQDYVAKRYIRHYAIASLAQAGSPAVMAYAEKFGKKKAPDGPVATTLLKVLVEKVPPNQNANIRMVILKDKVEAALGLCNMSYKNMPEYDPTLATYLIGATLLDFIDEYNKDFENFNAKAGAARKLPMHPFKIDAKRLEAGVKKHFDASKSKGAEQLAVVAVGILKDAGDYGRLNAAKVGDLERKVAELRPPGADAKVFRTLPEAAKITLPPAN